MTRSPTRAQQRLAVLAAAAFVLAAPAAEAQNAAAQGPAPQPPCLAPQEFTALATYTLPGIIDGVAQRCATSVPTDSFLRNGAMALSERYRQAGAASWPAAKAAFLKLSSAADASSVAMLAAMPDPSLQQIVIALTGGSVAAHVRPESCGAISRVMGLMAPLPPESTAELLGLAVGLGARGGQARFGKIAICGTAPPAPGTTASTTPSAKPTP